MDRNYRCDIILFNYLNIGLVLAILPAWDVLSVLQVIQCIISGFPGYPVFIKFQERQCIHDDCVFCVAYIVVHNMYVYLNFAING